MVQLFALAWAGWCVLNITLLLLAPLLGRNSREAFTNGLVVVVPSHFRDLLTAEELAAIVAHEQGHIAYRHALRNTLRMCFLMPRTGIEAFRQELEADNYAAARGHGPALASALRKISVANQDHYRANRLDSR